MSIALSVYHSLPGWAKNLAASARGHYLNRWRYDSTTESFVEEILERDHWDASTWETWQEERLAFVLRRAAERVPYYRDLWAASELNGNGDHRLADWPVLEKQTIRAEGERLVADDMNISKMFCDHTSGTTGTSINLWQSPETVRNWYALAEARWRRWYGVSRKDRWAILGGQLVTPIGRRRPPFWVWNSGLNQLYMSSYHLAPDLIGSYVEALKSYRVSYVLGYSSALYSIAAEMLDAGSPELGLKVAITNAEPLYDHQREAIEQAFGCPVRETYGMSEMAAAASECERGNLHIWPDAGLIEIDAEEGGTGDLLCTGLVNADMPLIRYRVGDRGSLREGSCDCGRKLPLMNRIEGRIDDVLITRDGRRIGRLDPVFKNDLPVKEAQIIQKSLDKVVVKVVPAEGYDRQAGADLSGRLKERMGELEVSIEEVDEIPRTDRGKFRAVVCEIPSADKGPQANE